MEKVDLDGARRSVSTWLDEHPSGSLAQMADELRKNYPAFPHEMAVVLRGMMAAELRRRTSLSVLPHIPPQQGAGMTRADQRTSSPPTDRMQP
jgi:hypothetical protein